MSDTFWKDIQKKTASNIFDQFFLFIFDVKNDSKIMSFERKNRKKIANLSFIDEFDVETNNKINNNSFKSNKIKMLILL